jgi:hypothetical protein
MTIWPQCIWDRILRTLANGNEPSDPQRAQSFLISLRLLPSHTEHWLIGLVQRLGLSQHVHRAKMLCPQYAHFITYQITDTPKKYTTYSDIRPKS